MSALPFFIIAMRSQRRNELEPWHCSSRLGKETASTTWSRHLCMSRMQDPISSCMNTHIHICMKAGCDTMLSCGASVTDATFLLRANRAGELATNKSQNQNITIHEHRCYIHHHHYMRFQNMSLDWILVHEPSRTMLEQFALTAQC